MTYKIVFDTKEYVDEWGYHEAKTREFDIPFEYDERVWYCYKKRKKYVIRESDITGIWATNTYGVVLNHRWHIEKDEFDRIFRDKNEAIDWCLKQNQRSKVKIERFRF